MVKGAESPQLLDVVITLRLEDDKVVVHEIQTKESEPQLNRGDIFLPGVYTDLAGNKYTVTGGAMMDGGRVAWAMKGITRGVEFNASWATGPLDGNPFANHGKEGAGVSFGIIGMSNLKSEDSLLFCKGGPIAATQIGDAIVIHRWHGAGNHLCMNTRVPSFQLQFQRVSDLP